jgi:hypothetical protein
MAFFPTDRSSSVARRRPLDPWPRQDRCCRPVAAINSSAAAALNPIPPLLPFPWSPMPPKPPYPSPTAGARHRRLAAGEAPRPPLTSPMCSG